MQAGACYGDIVQLPAHESMMALAKRFSVSGVRWNKASHTISFAERSHLMSLKLFGKENCDEPNRVHRPLPCTVHPAPLKYASSLRRISPATPG